MISSIPLPDFDFDDEPLTPIISVVSNSRSESISPDIYQLCSDNHLEIVSNIPIRCTTNSTVFHGRSTIDNLSYALKFSPHINRIREEAEKKSHLPKSDFLVNTIAMYETTNQALLQMEFCEKGDLTGKTLEESILWLVIHDIGTALDTIHSNGWIHLDVSPSNILFDGNLFKLADFGTLLPNGAFEQGCEGAGPYIAPETLKFPELPVGPPADIFSFGVVLLELASGFYAPRGGEARYGQLRRGEIWLGSDIYQCAGSSSLLSLINAMIAPDQDSRPTAHDLNQHPIGIQAAASRN